MAAGAEIARKAAGKVESEYCYAGQHMQRMKTDQGEEHTAKRGIVEPHAGMSELKNLPGKKDHTQKQGRHQISLQQPNTVPAEWRGVRSMRRQRWQER